MPIIIKNLGISTYGSFVLILTTLSIIGGISSLGIGVKSFRFLPSCRDSNEKAKKFFPPFFFKFLMLTLISFFTFILQDKIKKVFLDSGINFSFYILPFFLISYFIYEYSHNYLRYTLRIFYMSILDLAYSYLYILIIIIYIKNYTLDLNSLFIIQSIVALVISIPILYLIYQEIKFKFIFFKLSELRNEIKIGFPVVLNLIFDYILSVSDKFVLAYFISTNAVGIYTPAYTLGSLILLVPKAMGTILPQLISKKIDEKDFISAKELFISSIKTFITLVIPFIFGVYLVSYEILFLLANDEVARMGKYISLIIAFGSFFYGLNILFSQVLTVELKTARIFKANLIAGVFNLISNILLLYFIQDIIIAAITTCVSFFIATIYLYKSIDKIWFDRMLIYFTIKIFIISSLMFISNYFLFVIFQFNSILLNLLMKILLSIILYIILLFVFKVYNIIEVKQLFTRRVI